MPKKIHKKKHSANYDYLACCLQGGGAMGAYQVGVLKALQEDGYFPNWFIGTSIGAINSAIAVGNSVEERISKLIGFWETIATPTFIDEALLPHDQLSRRIAHFLSGQTTALFGQPHFFTPRWSLPFWENMPPILSYYDTAPLRETLEQFIDFDRINHDDCRLSVGAVEVRSGKVRYFDSEHETIGPEHIMASGALPPGFPPIEIHGQLFWDGGLSSNTPLSYVLEDHRPQALLCFLVHLFDSYGLDPQNLDDVEQRKKDIVYSSRFAKLVEMHRDIHILRYQLHHLAKHVPEAKKDKQFIQACMDNGWDKTVNLVRFLYLKDDDDLSSKDYEFSKQSILEHIEIGYTHGHKAIKQSPWLEPVPTDQGIALHDMTQKIPGFNNGA